VKRALSILLAAPVLVAATAARAAPPSSAARHVVVAGPADDPLAARVQKELTALGFNTVRIGGADGCSFQTLAQRVASANAGAAACSDGEQIGVWTLERAGLRLREVVLGGSDDHARDVAAVRAAEITRASVELREAEDEAAAARAGLQEKEPPKWTSTERDRTPAKPKPTDERRTPLVVAGFGMSSLLGSDASAGTFGAQAEVGILRWMAITGRLEYPIEAHEINKGGQNFEVSPGFSGAGVNLPLMNPSSFVIPRVGAGLGVAWINARAPDRTSFVTNSDGSITPFVQQRGGSDSTASPSAYLSAAVSLRIYGPLRLTADGLFGSTMSRMVVRSGSAHVAYWGQPFGALAVRMEILIR
jgi:hypothetical protein